MLDAALLISPRSDIKDDALGEGDMVMARPVVGRPLLGGLEERAAIALLRGAIRDRARVSDAEAGRMADARWRQLSNGNRAALVALMLERRELGQEQYEMAMGQREGELWSPEPLAKPARVEIGSLARGPLWVIPNGDPTGKLLWAARSPERGPFGILEYRSKVALRARIWTRVGASEAIFLRGGRR